MAHSVNINQTSNNRSINRSADRSISATRQMAKNKNSRASLAARVFSRNLPHRLIRTGIWRGVNRSASRYGENGESFSSHAPAFSPPIRDIRRSIACENISRGGRISRTAALASTVEVWVASAPDAPHLSALDAAGTARRQQALKRRLADRVRAQARRVTRPGARVAARSEPE